LNPFKEKGIPLEQQVRSWKDVVQPPYEKQTVDAFTRCRVILMNGIETEAQFFSHNFARTVDDPDFKKLLAWVRRIEHQQQNTVNWLNPADQSVLETTIGYEQVAVELTAYLARTEPDGYLKMAFNFGLLEDFDHLYRFGQALDLVHGKDPNEILQGRTDTFPGRPTQDHHNDPTLRILKHYDRQRAAPISKVNALTLMAGEQQTMNYYKNVGMSYGSPDIRKLYAEISNVEEEHVTQYECLIDPNETWLERWVMHEFTEVANYYTCYETEGDPRIKTIWDTFLAYELEHLRIAAEALQRIEGRDAEELCGSDLPTPATFETNREYVTQVLMETGELRLIPDGEWAKMAELPADWLSYNYQDLVNAGLSPTEAVLDLRIAAAGEELVRTGDKKLAAQSPEVRARFLDEHRAANTVLGDGAMMSMEEEVARVGPRATQVEDVRVSKKNGSKSRSKAAA
jgi:rubrerythrin